MAKRLPVVTFYVRPDQMVLANQLLAEAKSLGVKVSRFRVAYDHGVPEKQGGGIFAPTDQTLRLVDLRNTLRRAILIANGADPQMTEVLGSHYLDKEKIFKKSAGEGYSFCIWRDGMGRILAQGELRLFEGHPIVTQLLKLCSSVSWESLRCYQLFYPNVFQKEGRARARLLSNLGLFLFNDELDRLMKGEGVITYHSAGLMHADFEGFKVIDRVVYGIRGHLVD